VVDDDPVMGEMLAVFLGKRNYRAIFFTSGNQALAYLKNNPAILLLTDRVMPEMSGIELTRQVKTLLPVLPVIVMSGSADGQARDEIFALGADFIPKPFELVDLLRRINSRLPVR
jgi:DNA-binding response OmpR family regulator